MSSAGSRARAVLLYDRDCSFCRASLRVVLAWDGGGRLRAVALQDPEALQLLEGMDASERLASWHLVAASGERSSAGAALAPLLRLLPAGTPLALLAGLSPSLTERGYRWVAAHRSLLSRITRRITSA